MNTMTMEIATQPIIPVTMDIADTHTLTYPAQLTFQDGRVMEFHHLRDNDDAVYVAGIHMVYVSEVGGEYMGSDGRTMRIVWFDEWGREV